MKEAGGIDQEGEAQDTGETLLPVAGGCEKGLVVAWRGRSLLLAVAGVGGRATGSGLLGEETFCWHILHL